MVITPRPPIPVVGTTPRLFTVVTSFSPKLVSISTSFVFFITFRHFSKLLVHHANTRMRAVYLLSCACARRGTTTHWLSTTTIRESEMSGCLDKLQCSCGWLDPALEWLRPKRNMIASIVAGTLVGYHDPHALCSLPLSCCAPFVHFSVCCWMVVCNWCLRWESRACLCSVSYLWDFFYHSATDVSLYNIHCM